MRHLKVDTQIVWNVYQLLNKKLNNYVKRSATTVCTTMKWRRKCITVRLLFDLFFHFKKTKVQNILTEEELKRLHQMRFGQVGYNYDNPNQKNPEIKDDEDSEEPDEVFVPVPNFEIPTNIVLPDTMKEHAIIEKTAKFISTQGAQMEILIKTKQANNSQFDFLNHNSRLFNYYRHILSSMKNGVYPFNEAKDGESDFIYYFIFLLSV